MATVRIVEQIKVELTHESVAAALATFRRRLDADFLDFVEVRRIGNVIEAGYGIPAPLVLWDTDAGLDTCQPNDGTLSQIAARLVAGR